MGHIFIKTGELSITGYVIYRVVRNSSPLVERTRQAFAAPHPERGVTFDGLASVMHQVQLWESSDGTTLDTLHATVDIDAAVNNEQQVTLIEIEVDRGNAGPEASDTGDPVAGTDEYLDARMLGQVYTIEQRGIGKLKASEFTDNTTYGGFSFTGGNEFGTGDTFFICIYGGTTVTETESSSSEDVIEVAANITLDSSHYNNMVVATGTSTLQTFTFPSLATIPDLTKFSFSTQYGSFNYLKLKFAVAETIVFNGQTKNAIYLARDERLDGIVKDGVFYVKYYDGNTKKRGTLYGDNMQRTATLLADGTSYTKAQYEGLYDWLLNDAPSALKCSYTDWATSATLNGKTVFYNKALFAFDEIAETFKVPFVEGLFERYLKTTDTERSPNSAQGYQGEMFKSHTHTVATGGDDAADPNTNNYLHGQNPDGLINSYTTSASGGTETRGENIGKIGLIIL